MHATQTGRNAVVDASVLVEALVDSGHDGRWAESVIAQGGLASPELALVESANILRRLAQSGHLSRVEAALAFRSLLRLDVELFPFMPFAERVWELGGTLPKANQGYLAASMALMTWRWGSGQPKTITGISSSSDQSIGSPSSSVTSIPNSYAIQAPAATWTGSCTP